MAQHAPSVQSTSKQETGVQEDTTPSRGEAMDTAIPSSAALHLHATIRTVPSGSPMHGALAVVVIREK
jgi:hypothetical protein